MIPTLHDLLIWSVSLAQAPLLAAWALLVLYLLFLTANAVRGRVATHRRQRNRHDLPPATRFTILVPAHNEAPVIAECLRSLDALHYPAHLRRVVVIADNCTDATATIAARRGATVYERTDPHRRGKGYALDWAIRRLLAEDGGWTDAVVIFDADTLADPQFLMHMDRRLQQGGVALQGRYDLLNPFDNWRTALLYTALVLHNRARPLARQALGWTVLLKGNGMCFARRVVERFGWSAYSLAEDIEYTTVLLEAGVRVEYVHEAILQAQAPSTARQANPQRLRWEGGRFALARRDALRLLVGAVRARSAPRFDWAMDLLVPPTGILMGVPALMMMISLPLALLWGGPASVISWGWAATMLGIGVYVLGGLLVCSADRRAYLYLACTPLFLVWKLKIYTLMLLGRGPRGWVRTERTTIS